MCNLICNINCCKRSSIAVMHVLPLTNQACLAKKWGCLVLLFCNKIYKGFPFYRPLANVCSKWSTSRVWRDSRVKWSNQKLIGGECCMQDKASLFPQPAGAKRGLRIVCDQSYKKSWNIASFTYSVCKERRFENIPDGSTLISLFSKCLQVNK